MTFRAFGQAIGACATLLMCVAAAWAQAPAATVYTFAVEPTYTAEKAQEVYKPLIDYLARSTGEKFKLVASRNYHSYWSELRADRGWSFVFDEAHFTDYRIKRQGYTPLVRTLENTSYALLSLEEVPDNDPQGLVAKSITTMPAPSLAFALLLEIFPNPMQQPDIRTNPTSWKDTTDIVFAGEADAAMVPNWLYLQYPNLLPVSTTREFAGTAVSAHKDVPAEVQRKVKEALLALHEDEDMYLVISELGSTQFVEASAAEYAGAESMLKNFFGY